MLEEKLKKAAVLLRCEGSLSHGRIQVVAPALSALFAEPSVQTVGDEGPSLCSKSIHERDEQLVLLQGAGKPKALSNAPLPSKAPSRDQA
jgi:hypothetical protein